MADKNRTSNSIKNISFGLFVQILALIMSFATRTVFIRFLSLEYLGINGLFTNILMVLSLAEMGLGSVMVYSLYKPFSTNCNERISSLLRYYSKVYKWIGFIVGVIGLTLIPFLHLVIKANQDIDNIVFIYILFLCNSVFSYFFMSSRNIIFADQKSHIVSKYKIVFLLIRTTLQIFVLFLFKNFIIYLITQIICLLLENFIVYRKVGLLYPYIKHRSPINLNKIEKKEIWSNVRAQLVYRLGIVALDGTDNIIISAYISLAMVGTLSNYLLIISSLTLIVNQFIIAVTASIGDFIVKETKDRQEFLLKTITFVNFIIFGFLFACMYSLSNTFISLWLGLEYLMDKNIIFILGFNWFIYGLLSGVWTFRQSMGLFKKGILMPVISAILNIVISIFLVNRIGVLGVLIGTTITRFLTNLWFDPLIVYKFGLKKKVNYHYAETLLYICYGVVLVLLTSVIVNLIHIDGLFGFVIQVFIAIFVTGSLIFISFGRNKKMIYIIEGVKNAFKKDRIIRNTKNEKS